MRDAGGSPVGRSPSEIAHNTLIQLVTGVAERLTGTLIQPDFCPASWFRSRSPRAARAVGSLDRPAYDSPFGRAPPLVAQRSHQSSAGRSCTRPLAGTGLPHIAVP